MELQKFRDQIAAAGVVPRWLRGFNGLRFLYAIGAHIDWLADLLIYGLMARFPGQSEGATPYICRDRSLLRGPEETEAQIAERARSWQQDAALKGSPVTVLRQLRAYLTPHVPRIRLVNNQGRYFEISSAGEISLGNMAWNWDSVELNTRFWVLVWVPAGLWQTDGIVSDPGTIGDGGTIGSTASAGIVAGIRRVIRSWSSDNSRHMHTILIFDEAAWDSDWPNDGRWARVSARNPNAIYSVGDA